MLKRGSRSRPLKRREEIKKGLLLVIILLIFIAVVIYPEYCEYQNIQMLIGNKQRIVNAYNEGISEKEYLNELNQLEISLKTCQERVPEQKDQTVYYDRIMEEIQKSGIRLRTVRFGAIYLISGEAFKEPDKGDEVTDPEGRLLYGIPVFLSLGGKQEAFTVFLKELEEGNPYFKIDSFSIKEGKSEYLIEISCTGYAFCEK